MPNSRCDLRSSDAQYRAMLPSERSHAPTSTLRMQAISVPSSRRATLIFLAAVDALAIAVALHRVMP